jgi:hypothetical protein
MPSRIAYDHAMTDRADCGWHYRGAMLGLAMCGRIESLAEHFLDLTDRG